MTDEQMRVAIAEACGWKGPYQKEWLYESGPEGEDSWQFCGTDPTTCRAPLPDFTGDLNAMREAKLTIFEDETKWQKYRDEEFNIMLENDTKPLTAREEAICFLKTLNLYIA